MCVLVSMWGRVLACETVGRVEEEGYGARTNPAHSNVRFGTICDGRQGKNAGQQRPRAGEAVLRKEVKDGGSRIKCRCSCAYSCMCDADANVRVRANMCKGI